MMKYIILILFFIFSYEINSQNKVNIIFYDNCTDNKVILDYTLFDMTSFKSYQSKKSEIKIDSAGRYLLWSQIVNQDYNDSFSSVIEISNFNEQFDTISIPRIRMRTGSELHSTYWKYFNCDRICNGKEIDYYSNGNKRIEGIFEDGDPIQIADFREDGTIETKEFFKKGTLQKEITEFYDSNGNLDSYKIYKRKRRMEIIMTYDSKGKLITKETNKY